MSGPHPQSAWQSPFKLSKVQIKTELEEAIGSGLRKNVGKEYKKMAAILIHFQDDDIGCGPLEKELAGVFRNFYSFSMIKHLLLKNHEDPHMTVTKAITELSDKGYTEKDSLVIFVFSGHGQSRPVPSRDPFRAPENRLILGGALDAQGNFRTKELDWVLATGILKNAECDVLNIMDCCYAAEGMMEKVELLAASTQTAGSDADTCFKKALCIQLRRFSSERFTIATLYESLMTERRALKLDEIPFYHRCIENGSIILGRYKGSAVWTPPPKPDRPRVLLTAHLDESIDKQSLDGLKKWLSRQLPISIKDMEITLEGAWDASSSLLLFSLPVTVWAQLNSHNTGFNYVGLVTSNNKLLEQAPNPLALRPLPGPENIKPGQSSGQK